MNPVLKCDLQGERRALLLDGNNLEEKETSIIQTKKVVMAAGRQNYGGGYGSIAAQEWLLQGEDKTSVGHDHSESSSTCCSSSSDGEHNGEEVGHSLSFADRPVIVLLPDDELDEPSRRRRRQDEGNILKYQHTSLTDSTCTATTFGAYDEYDEELGGKGSWNLSESSSMDPLMVKPDSSGPCGVGRGLTFPGWEAYNQSLDENPVITKALTSLTGWFLGDLVTQTVITGGPFDVHRSIVLASFGFFFHGPVGHVIYGNLDQIIDGTGPKEIAAKIFVDQAVWCPVFMICYFTYLGLANGDLPSTIVTKIHSDMWTAVQGSWKVWILAHAIQFRYVKTKHRIIYINCIEVCFIMFLSFLGNR